MTLSACPSLDQTERLLRGELSATDVERLATHLEQCPSCAEIVRALPHEDALLFVVRDASSPMVWSSTLSAFVERLKDLRPGNASPSEAATKASSERAPVAPDELLRSLEPAQGAEELGRLGPYRLLRVLGVGGMGVVFEAEDTRLQRRVAVKAMKPTLAASDSARRRFLREAQMVAALEHDHIVPVYDVGEANNVLYLAMRLLQGESLERRLQREGNLPIAEALRIAREMAEGLGAAHARGLVHRDVKPANTWLEGALGRVKILDFGLARSESGGPNLTQSGAVVGTPHFMSPEQARGLEVDARSDLFSLGIVLYRMIAGRLPFQGPDVLSILMAVAHETPSSPGEFNPATPGPVASFILRLLAKDKNQRPAAAGDVARQLAALEHRLPPPGQNTALTGFGADAAVPTMEVSHRSTLGEIEAPTSAIHYLPQRRWRRRMAALSGFGLLVVAGLLIVLAQMTHAPSPATEDTGTLARLNGIDEPLAMHTATRGTENTATQPLPFRPTQRLDPIVVKPHLPAPPEGAPLSPVALTARPTLLKGVRSWTLETRSPRAHVTAAAYRPTGKTLATGANDGTVRLYEGDRLTAAFVASLHGIVAVAWSPDGKYLAAASYDGVINIWEAASGLLVRPLRFTAIENPMQGVVLSWSSDGKILSLAGRKTFNTEVIQWEPASGKRLRSLSDPKYSANEAAFSADGKSFASVPFGGSSPRLWDLEPDVKRTLAWHDVPSNGVAWAPDGKRLVVIGAKGLSVLDLEGERVLEQFPGIVGKTQALAWSPDGTRVGVAVPNRGVYIWDPVSGARKVLSDKEGDHRFLTWSADGRRLATGAMHGGLRSWDTATGAATEGVSPRFARADTLAWSPDGTLLGTGHWDSLVRVWSADTGKLDRALGDHKHVIKNVRWLDDGKTLASQDSYKLLVRSAETYDVKRSLTIEPGFLSDDAQWLARAADKKGLTVKDVETGQIVRTLDSTAGVLGPMAWSPDRRYLAAVEEKNMVRVWDMESGKSVFTLGASGGPLAWSPDGTTLACFGNGQFVTVRQPGGAHVLRTFARKEPAISVAWHPQAKAIAAGTSDGRILIYDTASTKLLHTLQGHRTSIEALRWSPDGGTLAACQSGDATVRFWDVATGAPRGGLVALSANDWLAFNASGHYVGGAEVEKDIVFVVQTAEGQKTYSPAEFVAQFAWKNEPERVRFR